jgi:hypothetical protein
MIVDYFLAKSPNAGILALSEDIPARQNLVLTGLRGAQREVLPRGRNGGLGNGLVPGPSNISWQR